MIIFLFLGIIAIAVGLLSIFSANFDQTLHRWFPDSASDRKFLAPESRYFIRRYLSGIKGLVGGVLAILLYLGSEMNLFEGLVAWLRETTGWR